MSTLMLIAGSDSSGGAGISRDVATATQLGLHASPVLTAVTAQTDAAVLQNHPVPPHIIQAQIAAAISGTPPSAIKIGMLGSAQAAMAVKDSLASNTLPVILDPVLKSTSGASLYSNNTLRSNNSLRDIFAITTLITPNLLEAASLTDLPVAITDADIQLQAAQLIAQGASAVLIKGGHGCGRDSVDHLFSAAQHIQFAAPRLPRQKRGTGCTLSTAIAGYIALGNPLKDACRLAKQHVHHWLGQ